MARVVGAEELRAHLGREIDALRGSEDIVYVSKRSVLSVAMLDANFLAEMIDRLEYLEDSLAALEARERPDETVAWSELR
jgi:hypothetical protein